jgi:hypothetical protein
MTFGSKEKLHQCSGNLYVGRASRGIDRRRGLPNNHLRDPAGIPDFHPRFHPINDAGKLSRPIMATLKYKETYDMQAVRRKAKLSLLHRSQWLYAVGILVLRSKKLLKVLTSIASRSLTVTDPQPNKIHFDKPTKPTQPNPGFPLIM